MGDNDRELVAVGDLVTIKQAIQQLHERGRKASRLSIWRFVRSRNLPVWRCGKTCLIRASDVLDGGYIHGDERAA